MQPANDQITICQIRISTLKGLGYEAAVTDSHCLQDAFCLLEIESKISTFVVKQWSEKKRN